MTMTQVRVASPDTAPPSDLADETARRFADAARLDERGALVVDAAGWPAVARHLRDALGLDYLLNLTVVDWPDRLETVYHIASSRGGPPLAVKVNAERANPVVPSVCGVWPGANLQEREAYDLFGVRYAGHPNLKRILLWEGFHGHPMRKDWREAYYEQDKKPFPSRWPNGEFFFGEDKLAEWGGNEKYPRGYGATEVMAQPIGEATAAIVESDQLRLSPNIATERLVVNMGPQHPSTHGVFQMTVTLDGETVVDLEPVMGYMHRNHEKIGERNLWLANMPFTDRLDYIAQLGNEWGYALAVEKMMGLEVPERAEYVRVILAELNRIQSHFWSIGFLLNDIGAFFTPALYAIEERELILDLFEMTCGSRLMCNYMRFGGLAYDLPPEFEPMARLLAFDRLDRAIDEIDNYLTGNEVVSGRLRDVGVLPPEMAIAYSTSGPVLRGSGIPYDVRRAEPYGVYDRFDWDVVTHPDCDLYARYMVRVGEMRQSVAILRQALDGLPPGEILGGKKAWQVRVPAGEVYSRVENPRGELGFHLVSDGGANPYRYRVKSPCFVNLTALAEMCKGHKVADVVAVLGSIDIVMGEVDR
jgi:NADH:ubiquinone oxidoreductase subunit D/NADH:ubiquinone oxidoreductase subunit C